MAQIKDWVTEKKTKKNLSYLKTENQNFNKTQEIKSKRRKKLKKKKSF